MLNIEYLPDLELLYGQPVPDNLRDIAVHLLATYGDICFTGSRIIGGWTDQSDWDVVVSCDVHDVQKFISNRNEKCTVGCCSLDGQQLFTSVRYEWVNIIFDHRGGDILDRWKIATDMAIDKGCTTKQQRIQCFMECGV